MATKVFFFFAKELVAMKFLNLWLQFLVGSLPTKLAAWYEVLQSDI